MSDTNAGLDRRAPAYVAYQTLRTFLASFKEHGLPSRIDKSVLKGFSVGVQNQLRAALRFLGLLDGDGRPQPMLKTLVETLDTDSWKEVMASLLRSSYPEMFQLTLESASPSEFSKAFKEAYNCDGDTLRKGQSFFLKAAGDADIKVSPYILKNTKTRTPSSRKPRSQKNGDHSEKRKKNLSSERSEENLNEETVETIHKTKSIAQQLLEKFPSFDPAWSDELKAKWFEGYQHLLALGDKK